MQTKNDSPVLASDQGQSCNYDPKLHKYDQERSDVDDDFFYTSSAERNLAMMSTADDDASPEDLLNDFSYYHKFKEEDVLDLPVIQFGKEVHLKAYRYPPKNYRKAVVFYLHGYGAYAQ